MNGQACHFCGLPAPGLTADGGPRYCCFGCRFAASVAAAGGDEGQARWAMTRLGLAVFFAMNVMVFTLLLWSQDAATQEPAAAIWYDLARYACLLFTLPVLFLLGGPLVEDAACELRRGRPSLSLLLVVGVAASFGYSLYSLLAGDGHVYFEVASTILVAVTLGRWLEATGKLKTTEALRGLSRLLPDEVRLVTGGTESLAPCEVLRAGDSFRVLPGERVAADGQITAHEAVVDEQAVTGESWPVVKKPGQRIFSGTLVLDGPLLVLASAPVGQGTLARMIEAVAAAATRQTRYQRLAERISQWFLPAVALVALATFIFHALRGQPGEGLLAALAVLVIACPCALGLATPMALWGAIGRAATAGVLIRDGDALAQLARAKTICFDKTGTLTTGLPEVIRLEVFTGADPGRILQVAGGLAAHSLHPLSFAIARYTQDRLPAEAARLPAGEVRTVPGRGLIGHLPGIAGPAYLGSRRWLASQVVNLDPLEDAAVASPELAETLIAWEGQLRGRFVFREDCRPSCGPAIAALQGAGLQTVMLTGDRQSRAQALSDPLNLACRAELLPEQKVAAVEEFKRCGPVVMLGDGINDAPALAAADVGIALGSGTDISRHTAAICLLTSDLARLPWLVALARETNRAVRWNLVWAFAYNIAGIGLAAAGWLHPVIAALAMGASGLLVVTNSLHLAQFPLNDAAADSLDSPQPQPLPLPEAAG